MRADGAAPGGLMGVVLAGGEGRRFGGPKALAPLAGRPMAAWALDALAPHFPLLVVVTSDPQVPRALGVAGRKDRIPGQGPLGGLLTALEWAREEGREGVFLLACDLPLVTPALVGRILAFWESGTPALAPGSPGLLKVEPLCAAYGTRILPVVEEGLRSGGRSLRSVLEKVEARRIPSASLGNPRELAEAFSNVNAPEDRARVASLLAKRR